MTSSRRAIPVLIAALAVVLPFGIATPSASAEPSQAEARPPASRLVHVCGPNLCVVDPASGAQQQITSDSGGYLTPDITPDGTLVAADRGDNVVVGAFGSDLTQSWATRRNIRDVAIAPDGSGVAESHSYVENVSRLCWPGPYLCLVLVAYNQTDYAPKGDPGGGPVYNGGNGAAFTSTGALLSGTYDLDSDLHAICKVDSPALPDQPCVPLFASTDTLTTPDASPDGTLVAVTSTPEGGASSVHLYASTPGQGAAAAPLRVIPEASSPAFSPDGTWVAYAGVDGWIHATPTAGGGSVKLAQGASPTWGGGKSADETPVPVASKARLIKAKGVLKLRKGAFRFTVRCQGDQACKGRLRVALKGTSVTKPATYTIEAGARKVVKATLSPKGKRKLRKGKTVKVRVKLPGSSTKVRIRR